MKFAKRVYLVAAVYGLVVLIPQYFLEERIGLDPPITHPEYFYGFIGIAIAWQVAFLIISSDPVRYRPMMVATFLEKAAFAIPVPLMFVWGRVGAETLAASILDGILGVLFVVSYVKTAPETSGRRTAGA